MTPARIIDFLSVLLMNKRVDPQDTESDVQFSHNYILKFLNIHKEYVNDDEVIKILVL